MNLEDASQADIAHELVRRNKSFIMAVREGDDGCNFSCGGTGSTLLTLCRIAAQHCAQLCIQNVATMAPDAKHGVGITPRPVKQGVSWLEEELAKP